jgi:membrane protein
MDGSGLPVHKKVFAIVKAAVKEFGVDNAGRKGAALSYYTIFSLVPLLFLVVAIAGFVFADEDLVDDLVADAGEIAGAEVASILESLVVQVKDQAAGALSIGLLLSAFSASAIFQQVQAVLAEIFHVPKDERRSGVVGWLFKRGVALVSALVLAVLAFTPIVAVAAVGWIAGLVSGVPGLEALIRLGVPLASLVVLMGVVGLSFQVLTPVEIPWKAAVRGGVATALVGLVAAWGVGQYLSRAGGGGTLGVLGGFAVLLIFFNLMWLVFLLGAEVTKTYADYLRYGTIMQPSERSESQFSDDEPKQVEVTPAPLGTVAALFAGLGLGLAARRRR